MMGSTGQIGEQNAAYRKGLVLGLTMAEVAILIIFVLLLLLALGEMRRTLALASFQGKTAVSDSELTELHSAKTQLAAVGAALGATNKLPPDDFSRLVRVLVEQSQKESGKTSLQDATQTLQEVHEARKMLEALLTDVSKDSTEDLGKSVEQEAFRLANQDGQIRFLQRQLAAAGGGKGERPCWAERDGTIDYLYDVVLVSSGIKMRLHQNESRDRELSLLPAPHVNAEEVLSEA